MGGDRSARNGDGKPHRRRVHRRVHCDRQYVGPVVPDHDPGRAHADATWCCRPGTPSICVRTEAAPSSRRKEPAEARTERAGYGPWSTTERPIRSRCGATASSSQPTLHCPARCPKKSVWTIRTEVLKPTPIDPEARTIPFRRQHSDRHPSGLTDVAAQSPRSAEDRGERTLATEKRKLCRRHSR